MDHSEINAYLDSFVNFESLLHKLRPEDFSLTRIEKFLELAGNPAQNLSIIHVAGTKGKGSTCAILGRILQEAGISVGLYTSPHLHKINERIRILNKENSRSGDDFSGAISDDDLGKVLTFLRPFAASILNKGNVLTFFEVLTVAALCYFAQKQVDIVILETGLGGRLDATNAVASSMAVITPVSLDHTRILGSTLGQIATEKAGIIKNSHQQVVIAPQEKESMEPLFVRCREFGIKPLLVDPAIAQDLRINLQGRHQMINAATAIEVIGVLRSNGVKIPDEAIREGLDRVRWPGRFELIKKAPDVIVDCAHNDASSQALSQTLKEKFPDRRVILVLGISQDKDAAAICHHLKENVEQIFLTQADHPRAYSFKEAECKEYFGDKPFKIVENLATALDKALSLADPEDVIVVTGSVFIVAEATRFIRQKHVSV